MNDGIWDILATIFRTFDGEVRLIVANWTSGETSTAESNPIDEPYVKELPRLSTEPIYHLRY